MPAFSTACAIATMGQQQFALQPMHPRLIKPLAGSLDDRECLFDCAKAFIEPPLADQAGARTWARRDLFSNHGAPMKRIAK